MAKMSKAKLSSMGHSIMSKAKEIRRKSPKKKWTTCVKEAGRSFRKSA